jgi:hypothetical protein
MAYDDERVELSRIPCSYVKITLNKCSLTFGGAPCTATGNPCYQTYGTCKDKTNYAQTTIDYKFTSNDAPLPFKVGERPYIKSVSNLPCEIKDEITVNQRVNVEMYDEPDSDVGLDPNYGSRAASYIEKAENKSYFKKLLSRHDNWYNKHISVYEGFSVATNLSTLNFKRKFLGQIKSIDFSGNQVKIEAVDMMANLNDISYPAPTNNVTLKTALATGVALFKMKVTNPQNLSTGLVAVGDEIMNVDSIDNRTGKVTMDNRGIFLTLATGHGKGESVQQVGLYTPQNPFDIMRNLLNVQASISTGAATGNIDTAAFVKMKTWPGRECYFTQVLPSPVPIGDLYKDLLRLTECRSWIDENQKITIGRGFLKNSSYGWSELSDSANIIEGSEKISLEADKSITQCSLGWDLRIGMAKWGKQWLQAKDKTILSTSKYMMRNVFTDTVIESTIYQGKRNDFFIETGWLHTSNSYPPSELWGVETSSLDSTNLYHPDNVEFFAESFLQRYVLWRSPARKVYELDVEMKDSTIAVGDQLLLSGDMFLDTSGVAIYRQPCFVTKKEMGDGFVQTLTMEDYGLRTALIAPDTQVDYISALATELEFGFISDTNAVMSDGARGYVIY